VLFAGPSLRGVSPDALREAQRLRLLPPVRRGDVEGLLGEEPGLLVLADGLFQDCLAVGHIEIREAVERGWQVWGLASMGAIRAYEMRFLGVRGYGRVYDLFVSEPDFPDDEVALLHSPDPDYTPFSEPLVHLRAALEAYQFQGILQAEDREAIQDRLKSLWYGDRTLDLFFRLVRAAAGRPVDPLLPSMRSEFDRYRLKSHDLDHFLLQHAWEESFRQPWNEGFTGLTSMGSAKLGSAKSGTIHASKAILQLEPSHEEDTQ